MNWTDGLGTTLLLSYYLVLLFLVPLAMRLWLRLPDELVRKTQHMAYAFSIFIQLQLFSTWFRALGAALILVAVGYPVLRIMERSPAYFKWLVVRSNGRGELRRQLLLVQVTFSVMILVCWGLFGPEFRYLAAAAVMAWGFGDAAAALVGRYLGRNRFQHRLIEGAKTREGTTAMVVVAATALFLTLLIYGGLPWYLCLAVALVVAPVSGAVELFSRRGYDTITVPLSTLGVALPLILIFQALGW